ncbi:MAG TPA: M14 family metallopeptidase [Casimicrobiaceae bacterium]|nr:M14 family metallopeptidase [Casimicrobiaceae bacterium]
MDAPPSAVWSDVDVVGAFAATYADARAKFLAAAARRGLAVETHEHPRTGPDGGMLAVDVAVLGQGTAEAALVLTSAAHGVEGFCGSGCQVALLEDDAFVAHAQRRGVAVVFVHALNPWGFAHLARTTEDNVDLNRNFRDFGTLARNDAYLEVHPFIVPAAWPPAPDNEARMTAYVAQRGIGALQDAVSTGQSDRPDGLFFAGTRPTWSHGVLRDVLRRHGAHRARLGWIDYHTGLGPRGHGEKIFAGPDDAGMLARVRAWWGADVTSIYDGSSTSAKVTGMLFRAALEECPSTEYTGIALEYGTLPLPQVMQALRARQWLANQGDAVVPQREAVLRLTRDAFYTDTPAWKAMVAGQSRAAALQALAGLSGRPT